MSMCFIWTRKSQTNVSSLITLYLIYPIRDSDKNEGNFGYELTIIRAATKALTSGCDISKCIAATGHNENNVPVSWVIVSMAAHLHLS